MGSSWVFMGSSWGLIVFNWIWGSTIMGYNGICLDITISQLSKDLENSPFFLREVIFQTSSHGRVNVRWGEGHQQKLDFTHGTRMGISAIVKEI